MNLPIILAYPLAILANSALALIVFFRNSKDIVNRFFALFTLAVVGWLTTLFLSYFVTTFEAVNLLTRLYFAFILLLVYAVFYFAYYFPKKTFPLSSLLHVAFSLETFGLIALTLSLYKISWAKVSGVKGILAVYGEFYPLFVIHFVFYIASALLLLFSKLKKFKGFPRAQIQCLLFGLSAALVFELILQFLIPFVFKINTVSVLRPFTTLFFLGFTSYGIVKFRLLDIRLIVARTIAYFLLSFLVILLVTSALYAFSVFVVGQFIGGIQLFVFTLLVLFILLAFPTLNSFLSRATDEVFLKDRYDSAVLLRELSLMIVATLSLEDLIRDVLAKLTQEMKISQSSVVVIKDSQLVEIKAEEKKPFTYLEDKGMQELLAFLDSGEDILIRGELKGKIKKFLKKFKAEIVVPLEVLVPLRVRGKKVGFLLLGEKSSGEIYSAQDITVLEIIAPELALAVQNSLAFDEIKRFNATLKEKIKKATDQLRQANEVLKELDKLKDDFLSIATHELRTPMTAIKGYLDMILSGDTGKINPKTREFLIDTFEVADRMSRLVNDMLDVSRIEEKRLKLEIREVDLAQEIKKVIEQLQVLAKEKKLILKYQSFQGLPLVKADPAKVNQILSNIIVNAIKFTEKGGVTISHQVKNGFIVTQIKDTGIGIAAADMNRLFKKFSKLDGGLKREGGTGLGLYVSKGLVKNMGGKLWVHSKVDQGSTFSFSLPWVKKNGE